LANPDENKDDATSDAAEPAEAEGVAEARAADADGGDDAEAGEGAAAEKADDDAKPAKAAAGAKAPSPGARLAAQRAAKAAAKAAKRGKTAADEVEQKAEARAADVAGWVDKNRPIAYGALAAVLLVVAGYVGWSMFGNRTAEQAAVALGEALDVANAEIRSADAPAPENDTSDRETFTTTTLRATKALDLFRKVTRSHSGTDAAVWARLGEAHALLDLGQPANARAAYEKALREGSGDSAVAARAFEGIAFTYEAENQPAKAIEKFEALSRAGEGAYKDLADYHLARMYLRTNAEPRAKRLLEELVTRLRARDDREPGDVSPFVLGQAELRLAELGSSLVQRPTQGMGGGSMFGPGGVQLGGEGGGGQNFTPEQIQEILRNLQKNQGGGAGGAGGGLPPGEGE
jgi:tetratricopeptide (TPR) repeat protein